MMLGRAVPEALRPFRRPDLRAWVVEQRQAWTYILKTLLAALIALWLAYRLELQSPSTAVVTVFIVMQARTGMVLAKGFYRALGTLIGSVVSLLLVAEFAQARVLFLIGLALWVGACTAGAYRYRNFQSYAFVLAGYTACLVGLPAAMDPIHAFDIAVTRVSEVLLGILAASVVSGIVFPQPMRSLLIQAARQRFQTFAATTGRVLTTGIPRREWGNLHLKAIHEIVTLDGYRSMGIFENSRTRRQDRLIRRMSAEMISSASTLHLLNTHLLRLHIPHLTPVRTALDRLLADWREALNAVAQAPADGHPDIVPRLRQLRLVFDAELPQRRKQAAEHWQPDQRLAFDTALELLSRFLDELIAYSGSYAGLVSGDVRADAGAHPTDPEDVPALEAPRTEWTQPIIAAVRTGLIVAVMSGFWIETAWPSGLMAAIIAVIISALFSTAPNPAAIVRQMWLGVALALLAALVFQLLILPRLEGFPLLAISLVPFLILSPLLQTRPGLLGVGAGFGIFFSNLALPDNLTHFDPIGVVNNGISQLLAVSVAGIAFMLLMPAGNWWVRARLFRALNLQIVAACQGPLDGLRRTFERDTRELLRQLVTVPTIQTIADAAVLRRALIIQELGYAVIELRQLGAARALPQYPSLLSLSILNPTGWRRLPSVPLPATSTESADLDRLSAAIQDGIDQLASLYRHPDRSRLDQAWRCFDVAYRLALDLNAGSPSAPLSRERRLLIYLHLIRGLLRTLPVSFARSASAAAPETLAHGGHPHAS